MKIKKGKFSYYLIKGNIVYVTQSGFKDYMAKEYNVSFFRCPDEAYIIKEVDIIRILILEKKEQCSEGSVETKLWAAPSLKREYELVIRDDKFKLEYKFCVNNFLKNKIKSECRKYEILREILSESKIDFLYGEDIDYFDKLNEWIFREKPQDLKD